jgi:hypothetical protein
VYTLWGLSYNSFDLDRFGRIVPPHKDRIMKILALDKIMPGVQPQKDIYPHMHEEMVVAWDLHKSGVIREMYFRQDRPGAVLVLECANATEAREVVNKLPLVKKGLVDFDLIPLGFFAPLEALFAHK